MLMNRTFRTFTIKRNMYVLNVAPEIDIQCQVLRVEGNRAVGKGAEKGPL